MSNLMINGYQTTIPLSIELMGQNNNHQNKENAELTKMNDIEMQERYTELVKSTLTSEKERKKIIKQNVMNKFILLKPTPNQVYNLREEAKWNEIEATRIIEERINTLDTDNDLIRSKGGIWNILYSYLQSDDQTSIIRNPSNLKQFRADTNKYAFNGVSDKR